MIFMKKEKSKKAKQKKTEQRKKDAAATLKEMEKAMFAIRFYPVAVDEGTKDEAIKRLIKIYNRGDDTVRQMLLYMVHEALAKASEFRVMHTKEYFKVKKPNEDPTRIRMEVYRAIFNYNTSAEGVCELCNLLSRLNKDEASKLLTYHYSRLTMAENEGTHMLRAAIIDALGKSESRYALNALLEYAKYTDSDRTMSRIVNALLGWERKLEGMKLKPKEKEELLARLHETITKETGGSHYG